MATSGTISTTTFNTNKVIDSAFRRCRLFAEAITPEMQSYAKDSLYLLLSELANIKPPSWCIEKVILPMYENNAVITLPVGTVDVLNVNYRTVTELTGSETSDATTYKIDFGSATQVTTVGVNWSGTSVAATYEVSSDDITYTTVATYSDVVSSGMVWVDIAAPKAYQYFRITVSDTTNISDVVYCNNPSEIPFGVLNRDAYTQQTNKVFPGRPTTYWFQRDLPEPVMNLWPAPNSAAEKHQLVVWRHRHIMDVGTLTQEIEVPQRWIDAIIANLAARLAAETPQVDAQLIPSLDNKAQFALLRAWDGDNDGSSTFIQPQIGCYTR